MGKGTGKSSSRTGSENSSGQPPSQHPRRPGVASDELGDTQPDEEPSVGEEADRKSTSSALEPEAEQQNNADRSADAENPQTRCPNCETVFEVSPDLLASDDTRVRCGECLIIFDALTNLRNDDFVDDDDFMVDEHGNIIENDSMLSGAESLVDDVSGTGSYRNTATLNDARTEAIAGLASDDSVLDMTYSDIDLFSEEAGLPDVVYFDKTRDAGGTDFDALERDETFSDTLFAQDLTAEAINPDTSPDKSNNTVQKQAESPEAVDFVSDDVPASPLVFNYRDKDAVSAAGSNQNDVDTSAPSDVDELLVQARANQAEPVAFDSGKKKRALGLKSVLILLIVCLAGGLYVYRDHKRLIGDPRIRPILESACSILRCVLPVQQDLDALKVLKRTVYTHPSIDNALVIDLAFVNQAAFAQPFPTLGIRLTDRNGRLVVKNSFTPDQYLDRWQASDELATGKRLDLTLTVEDPGQTATSFELDFIKTSN